MESLFTTRFGDVRIWVWVVGWLAAIALLIGIILLPIVTLQRHYGRINCTQFQLNTGRDTRFVVRSFVDTGECFARTDSGWLPADQLRDVAP